MTRAPEYSASVFINCPFDKEYDPIFEAVVFTIFDCGFIARCALELDDGSEVRLEKIFRLIDACKFAVHDLSRTELDEESSLPRINMPLELGIFLGAKRFGSEQNKQKIALILDRENYRYQIFISDIAGQDIHAHGGEAEIAVTVVRNWLSAASKRITLPGGSAIVRRFAKFKVDLPVICRTMKIDPSELRFIDFTHFVSKWLKKNAS